MVRDYVQICNNGDAFLKSTFPDPKASALSTVSLVLGASELDFPERVLGTGDLALELLHQTLSALVPAPFLLCAKPPSTSTYPTPPPTLMIFTLPP